MIARKLEKYLTRQFEEHVSRDSIEREQKYRVARVDTIRKRLLKLGAQIHASGFERNELYDCDDRLRRQDLKLRLRCHGGKIAMLTLKGPRQNEHQKTRMEVETPVEYTAAKRILELLDFRVKETYSKVRENIGWRVARCALITFLTPDGLSRLKAHEEKSVKRRGVLACDRPIANTAPIVNSSRKPRR
jgi:CYTH domain